MKIENKRSEITKLIDNIKKSSDHLNELETIPVLEIGVILSKINQLHEAAAVLRYLCEVQQGKRVELQSNDFIVTPIPKEVEEEFLTDNETTLASNDRKVVDQDAIITEKENNTDDTLNHIIEAPTEEEVTNDDSIDQVLTSDLFAEKKTVESIPENEDESDNDKLAKENYLLNDDLLDQILEEVKDDEKGIDQVENLVEKLEEENEISSKPDINEVFAIEDSSISGHLQKQPIADLMSAIGLNERYLYANDLFDGDMQEFKNAVKMLNEFENGEEAKSFFESGLRSTYNWEDDNTLAQALFSLVERRHL